MAIQAIEAAPNPKAHIKIMRNTTHNRVAKGRVTFACTCAVDGKTVTDGEAVIIAPRRPS
jgi:hypothetical protein